MSDLDPGPPAPISLPDPKICRTYDMGIGEFSECKVRDPLECRHALRFGYGWLCRHPQWRQFLNNALGAQGPALPPAPAEAASE